MNTKRWLNVLAAAALLLVILFVGPITYLTGQRVGLYLNCPQHINCWAAAGFAIMHGGKLPDDRG